jgi:hypothetical protein
MFIPLVLAATLSGPTPNLGTPPSRPELAKEFGYEIPECSQATGVYKAKVRESGEYQHIEHGVSLELFNDGKFLMAKTFDNTTNPKVYAMATFSGFWMEYTGARGRTVKLLFDSQVSGEIWTLSRLIGLLKTGQPIEFDLETYGNDGIRVFSELARRESKGEPYCRQTNPAVAAFFANLQNEKAWQAVKKDFTGDLQTHLALALEANKVFAGRKAMILDTIAALYALSRDFSRAVDYQTRAVELLEARPEPSDAQKKQASDYRQRLELYRSNQTYRAD